MILTTSYQGKIDTKRDLLAGFSSLDYHTTACLDDTEVDRAFLRLLLRITALCSLHGRDVPTRLVQVLRTAAEPFAVRPRRHR